MATEIKVPSVGESITEGTVSRWLKEDGAQVRADELVFELETEKATTEVAAPVAGTLRITVPQGSTVAIGAVVGRIEEGSPAAAPTDGSRKPAPGRQEAKETRKQEDKETRKQGDKETTRGESAEEVRLSPSARRLAEEEGLDVQQLTGSGPGGRITKEDVIAHLRRLRAKPEKSAGEAKATPEEGKEPKPTPPTAPWPEAPPAEPRESRQRMSSIRQRIAERLVAAKQNAAILTTFNEADLSAVLALRARYKERFQEKHGVNLGFMSFFVKAAVEALRAFPVANAWIDGDDVVYHNYYNIGVAVSSERGLMVPVLRDADRLSFAEVERRIAELAKRAREGRITVDDLQGGTFTITNGGVFGSLLSTPILNPPQSAILGMHAIQKRPVAVDDQVVVRPMMYLALSYDHRLIDGREAVLFLVRIKECIENPERMLLDI
jgi:2-oxoglutarate dehydrogenase E2 component (dihydrolipoamide succinyltransferase)